MYFMWNRRRYENSASTRARFKFCNWALLLIFSTGCEQCAPGLVAQGVSRLTIRNFGSIVQLVNDDDTCGFESEAVKTAFVMNGEPGEQGSVRYDVSDCRLSFERSSPKLSENCSEDVTGVAGTVTVTGHRTIRGYLTGDPAEPVIPSGPDAVAIEITSAKLEDFQVDSTTGPEYMIMLSGEISGKVMPRIAAAADTGVCSIPTGNISISDVKYTNAQVRVFADGRDFIVPIANSNLNAIHGQVGERENSLYGEIQVWESKQTVPTSDDESMLDPEYDRSKHYKTFECAENLALPVRYDECTTDIRPLIAQGSSQLAIQTIGNLARFLDENTSCGYESAAVIAGVQVQGVLGDRGGQGTWTIDEPCEIYFPEPTVLNRDCHGKETIAQGRVRLTGQKIVRGIPSGHAQEPIVPTSWEPANVSIHADFEDFTLWTEPSGHKLKIVSGGLSAKLEARVAKDKTRGACSKKTPLSHFTEIAYADAHLVLNSEGRRFEFTVNESNLEAQNGKRGALENYLAGTITLDGEQFDIPVGDSPILDPEYDPEHFLQSFTCDPELVVAQEDADCDMYPTLGEGLGRLMVMSVGTIAGMTNDDADCGFESNRVLLRPDDVQGDPGQNGLMQWSISDCVLAQGPSSPPIETDCLNRKKYVTGTARVNARRTVTGLREKLINIGSISLIDSIVPTSHESVHLELQNVDLTDFYIFELNPNETEPGRYIKIHSGTLSAVVEPITGENSEKPGAFDIGTSVAHMTNVRLVNADVTIMSEGKTFNMHVDDSALEAFNGSYSGKGMTNMIQGKLWIDGNEVTYPGGSRLDPEYDQADFDSRYACTEGLLEIIPTGP
jgi:hypothetical protein